MIFLIVIFSQRVCRRWWSHIYEICRGRCGIKETTFSHSKMGRVTVNKVKEMQHRALQATACEVSCGVEWRNSWNCSHFLSSEMSLCLTHCWPWSWFWWSALLCNVADTIRLKDLCPKPSITGHQLICTEDAINLCGLIALWQEWAGINILEAHKRFHN